MLPGAGRCRVAERSGGGLWPQGAASALASAAAGQPQEVERKYLLSSLPERARQAPADLFRRMWALTEGKRLRKRRHAVEEGPLTWEVDHFLDRELVFAEVELAGADTPVELPAWLAPHVVREVTGEDAYVNVNLAGPEQPEARRGEARRGEARKGEARKAR